jgi:Fe(3+) dicitrate transport protein
LTKGAEIFLQADWLFTNRIGLTLFTSTAFLHARYTNAIVKSGNNNINIDGNKVESAPDLITRSGVSIRYRKLSFSLMYSYTSESYADALNTVEPLKTTGAVGLVPSYGLLDFNSSFRFTRNLEARVNINNLFDKQYFTKRPTFYPGPGIWPSDGRNASVSVLIRI